MRGINKVILLGNVGKAPELRQTAEGRAIATFSVATHRERNSAGGQREHETEWHRAVAFGRTGEIAGQLLGKGTPVYIEGRLRLQKWTDREGNLRHGTEIWVDVLQALARRAPLPDEAADVTPTGYVPPEASQVEADIPF